MAATTSRRAEGEDKSPSWLSEAGRHLKHFQEELRRSTELPRRFGEMLMGAAEFPEWCSFSGHE
jgi:hypothetical protein